VQRRLPAASGCSHPVLFPTSNEVAKVDWLREARMETRETELELEGLAAQLYVQSKLGRAFVWWHLASDEVKRSFRRGARAQIAEFKKRSPF
jgi:hypothetical protein